MKLYKSLVSAAALMLATMGGSALADNYSWPDNIPPAAKELMTPLPLWLTGTVRSLPT